MGGGQETCSPETHLGSSYLKPSHLSPQVFPGHPRALQGLQVLTVVLAPCPAPTISCDLLTPLENPLCWEKPAYQMVSLASLLRSFP